MSLLAPALLALEDIMMGIDIKTTLQILALLFLQLAAGQDELIVSTGKVRGLRLPLPGVSEYVAAFLGIPYAKPQLDQLRFRQPEPAEVWNGIRDATQYSNSYTLYPGFPGAEMWNPNTRISEDCFSTGTASLGVYDGRFLSHSQQVVVVSMNYRVGALGFLSLPESESIKGNAGLFDQESAGAGTVGHHLLSQGSHGLFTRAILQSGSPNAVWAAVEPAQAWNRSLTLAQLLNCPLGPSADEMEACLRAVESEKIVSLQFEVIPDPVIISVPFPPTVDGEFLVDMPSALIQSGHFLKTELLLGLNRDEGTYFLVYGTPGSGIHNQSLISRDQFLAGVCLGLPGSVT
uniref:Butyrylcholinesterase n=1 Tax=Sinocyclocheilus rhinocerous TaxID=307959 RepID=A0A673K1H0_9TELE